MKDSKFQRKSSLCEIVNNYFTYNIYRHCLEINKWRENDDELLDPLEYVNSILELLDFVEKHYNTPLLVSDYLYSIDLDRIPAWFGFLGEHINSKVKKVDKNSIEYEQLKICLDIAAEATGKYELWEEENHQIYTAFSFTHISQEAEQIDNLPNRIKFWLEKKTHFEQAHISDMIYDDSFAKKCSLEIDKLRAVLELDNNSNNNSLKNGLTPQFQRRIKLSKVDLIRILNTMYEMGHFDTLDKDKPLTKSDFMKKIGVFFNEDLSNYDASLSQDKGKMDNHLKIFQAMLEHTKNMILDKDKK